MALSYYATTRPGALSVAMNSSTTVVPLVSAATFPDPTGPGNSEYTVIIGYGSDREEVCTVTAKVGDSLTVIRGQDSTAATGKNQGDVVVHGVSARDFKTFVPNTDPRLTDARTPTVHAPSHATGGSDVVTPAAIGAATMAQVTAAVDLAIPIGGIIMWSGTTPPTNWALCNGLNGTPNLTNRFIVATGGAYALGATGGADTVALTTAQMPSHSHGGATVGADGWHAHGITTKFSGGMEAHRHSGYGGVAEAPNNTSGDSGAGTDGAGSHQHNISAEGGGAAHENRPPYYALAFIQRKT